MKRLLFFFVGVAMTGGPAWAQHPITTHNTPVLETFASFDGSGFAPVPGPGQLDADDFALLGLSDGDLPFGAMGTAGDYARGLASGGVATGGVYSFETAPGNFGLGVQPTGSDFTPGAFVVRYVNLTATPIDNLNVEYDINVFNDQDRSSTLMLSYASSNTCVDDPRPLAFTDVPAAAYASPEVQDPSPSWQTVQRGVYLSGLTVSPAQCLYLQFTSDDLGGSGSRDQLALDNLVVTTNPNTPLPVELTSFQVLLDGNQALLRWETASETNNAGFEIQYREAAEDAVGTTDDAVRAYRYTPQHSPWQVSTFIAGAGTTLTPQTYSYRTVPLVPGRYVFRLKQIDYDGTFTYSPQLEVLVGMSGTYHLSKPYPNPFSATTSFSLSVIHPQRVAVRVYDLMGRPVAVLHDGPLEAASAHTFTFEAGTLPSGLYLIRIQGERFAIGQAAMLTK